jgi:hypothetical protein
MRHHLSPETQQTHAHCTGTQTTPGDKTEISRFVPEKKNWKFSTFSNLTEWISQTFPSLKMKENLSYTVARYCSHRQKEISCVLLKKLVIHLS